MRKRNYDQRTRRINAYIGWVMELSEQQMRALASQLGFSGFMEAPLDKVRSFLTNSDAGQEKYEEIYGCIQ